MRLTQTVLFSSIIYGTICGQFDFLKDIVRQVQDEFPNKFDGIVEKIKDNGVYTKVTDGFDNLERFNKELNEKELRNQRFIETSYDNLLRNLNLWYPNFSAFNSKIKEFLKSVSAHEQNFFHQMVSERKAFEQYATSYIEEFAKLHGNVITEALYQQIRNILAYEFQFDIVEVERKLSRIIESGNVTSSDLVYEISKLKMIVEPIVSEIAFNKLEGSLQLWYPNLKKLNELLLSFLNTKKINPKLIEDMSADQQSFKTNLKTHSSEFSEIHRRVIVEEVFKQIKKFLIENYADQSERHQQIILDFRRNPEIDDSYTVDLLYDVTKLRNKLKPSIDSKLQNIALNNLENRLSTWYPHLNNFNSLLIQFMSMTNIRTKTLDEMSVNKFNFKLQANQTFFQFSKVYRRQIIFEIYGQIKIILQTDFRKEANRHDAILEELKSSRAIDITYKADLLYDMAKLKEKVTPTVNRTIQKLDINEAYAKLKNNLETWLPNNRNFSRNFIEFSKSKFTIVTTIKSLLESKEAFFSTKNQLLLKYSTEQRAVLQQDVYEQVEALLTEMNKWNPSKVNQDMEKLRRSSIEIKFTPQIPLQAYQVKESTTIRPKPLSDEFSNEFTSSGENYSNNINGYTNNRHPSVNTANRFGPQNDFPSQLGYGQQYPGAFQGGPAQFPGAGQYPGGGQFQGAGGQFPGGAQAYPYPGQFQGGFHPGGHGGYPGGNSIANGILVGPGGPTGIIGRPYGQKYPQHGFGGGGYPGAGFGGGYPGSGFGGGYPQGGFGYEGQYNGLGPYGGGAPFNQQFGGPGGFQGPLFDSTSNKNLQVKKIQKSAE